MKLEALTGSYMIMKGLTGALGHNNGALKHKCCCWDALPREIVHPQQVEVFADGYKSCFAACCFCVVVDPVKHT